MGTDMAVQEAATERHYDALVEDHLIEQEDRRFPREAPDPDPVSEYDFDQRDRDTG